MSTETKDQEIELDIEFETFDPSTSNDVHGLLFLGSLHCDVRWCGHVFTLKTLSIAEELSVALIAREYADSIAQLKAFATATIAASLVNMNGDPFMPPVSEDSQQSVKSKFDAILKWNFEVVRILYEGYLRLNERQEAAFKEFQGKS